MIWQEQTRNLSWRSRRIRHPLCPWIIVKMSATKQPYAVINRYQTKLYPHNKLLVTKYYLIGHTSLAKQHVCPITQKQKFCTVQTPRHEMACSWTFSYCFSPYRNATPSHDTNGNWKSFFLYIYIIRAFSRGSLSGLCWFNFFKKIDRSNCYVNPALVILQPDPRHPCWAAHARHVARSLAGRA